MEVRVALAVLQGPVGDDAVLIFEHDREGCLQVSLRHEAGAMHVDVRFQPILATSADDLRRMWRLDGGHATAVIIEAIYRPLAGRRKIQLHITAFAFRADESFEAR